MHSPRRRPYSLCYSPPATVPRRSPNVRSSRSRGGASPRTSGCPVCMGYQDRPYGRMFQHVRRKIFENLHFKWLNLDSMAKLLLTADILKTYATLASSGAIAIIFTFAPSGAIAIRSLHCSGCPTGTRRRSMVATRPIRSAGQVRDLLTGRRAPTGGPRRTRRAVQHPATAARRLYCFAAGRRGQRSSAPV